MRSPAVDDKVRLMQDIPELSLSRGIRGIVRSMWCAPCMAYEVEFPSTGESYNTRALLMAEQVQVDESPDEFELISAA